MIIEMVRDWWLRWLDWRSGRSTASRRLEALGRLDAVRREQRAHERQAREQQTVRRRRLDGNRGRHWSTEVTVLTPTIRPLLTYAQQLGYQLPPEPALTRRGLAGDAPPRVGVLA
jgi:hypothetical protein